jgi:hypothetical protein
LSHSRAGSTTVGKPLQLNLIDRFEFLDGRVIFGQAYFDTVALLSVVEPSINTVQCAPSAVHAIHELYRDTDKSHAWAE